METGNKKTLDMDKLRNRKSGIISSEKALEEVERINWSEDVLSGKKKAEVEKNK